MAKKRSRSSGHKGIGARAGTPTIQETALLDSHHPSHKNLTATATYDAFDPRPAKKSKLSHGSISKQLHLQSEKPVFNELAAKSSKSDGKTTGLSHKILSPDLQHLASRYEFTTMSIISSSKINQKVSSLLKSLEKFNFADMNAKPGVVVLTAKSNTAAKMISIVEIAKRSIDKEKARWYEYSRLHGEITELKVKAPQIVNGGKSSQDRKQGQDEVVPGAAPRAVESEDVHMAESEVKAADEADFENMDSATVRAIGTSLEEPEPRKKVRAVPVMVTYMTRVSIPEFKAAYG